MILIDCLSRIIAISFEFKEIINYFLFQAEQAQSQACEKFENMSAKGREELTGFRARQVTAFKKRWDIIDINFNLENN